jgi:glycosyltransferase involved in cell wall biosynthesis
MKVDLHLVSWNRPKMTELVIRTINKNTKRDNYRLVVFDNGSDMETVKMLFDLQDNGLVDEVFSQSDNKGLEYARQYLLENSTYGDYFVCIDNDCLPPPIRNNKDWIEELIELMQKYEDFAAISMRTQVMIGTGNIFQEADELDEDIVEFPHPGGSYRIMRTFAVKEVGGWDREAPLRGAEERYICGKLNEEGYRTAFSTNVQCLHLFGTRATNPTDRWGYDVSLSPEETGHSDIHHPALVNGDDYENVVEFTGEELAKEYFDGHSNN